MSKMRDLIYKEVASISPFDAIEGKDRQDCLDWIESGSDLCRFKKPADPPKHLVSYFVVIDDDHILLVDHRNAQLWLPTGGHVEPGEHPKETVVREAQEELGIKAQFLLTKPLFITVTETVGLTAGHVDVSIWYVLKGSVENRLAYDESEFRSVKWFEQSEVPLDRSDPNMGRFLKKLGHHSSLFNIVLPL
ncbi:MAG: NUDIX hydrolase [Chloroflexi bacterium]|nr:NUDIX hydrolase [Chloroflexota bacterium]